MTPQSIIILREFNEWVGTLYDATPEEIVAYTTEVRLRLIEEGTPKETELIIYKVEKNPFTVKL